jgi:hypothetical protein
VIKEHLERLQKQHHHTEAFRVMSDWANENTSERTDDPFCLDNVRVPLREQLAIPDMSDTDATTSERSEDPFQMSYASGMTSVTRSTSASAGVSPRRRATSRRLASSGIKLSSRNRRGSGGGLGDGVLAAPSTLELTPLPELSTLGADSDDDRKQILSSDEGPVGSGTTSSSSAATPARPRRERSVSPTKRKPMDSARVPAVERKQMESAGLAALVESASKCNR